MHRGHDPRDVREYPWRDIVTYLIIEQQLDARQSIGNVRDED
jgi:hypothetical protein